MTVEIVGPVQYHAVVVDGRRVPYLTASPRQGEVVEFVLDDRISLDVQVADWPRIGRFLADAIAVGMGYTAHPGADSEPVPRHGFPRWTALAANETQQADPLHSAAEIETPSAVPTEPTVETK